VKLGERCDSNSATRVSTSLCNLVQPIPAVQSESLWSGSGEKVGWGTSNAHTRGLLRATERPTMNVVPTDDLLVQHVAAHALL